MVQIEIIGNLGADVREVNYNGSVFYTFNVCDNKKVNGQEVSQWFGCNINRKSEILQYLVKGQQVFVRGVPSFRIFDSARSHMKMVAVDIFVNEIQLVGAAPKQKDQDAAQADGQDPAANAAGAPHEPTDSSANEGDDASKTTESKTGRVKKNGSK